MITGTSPDLQRDYNIGKLIPGCEESFRELSNRLYGLVDQLESLVARRARRRRPWKSWPSSSANLRRIPRRRPAA